MPLPNRVTTGAAATTIAVMMIASWGLSDTTNSSTSRRPKIHLRRVCEKPVVAHRS